MRVMISLSGGMDSATVLGLAVSRLGYENVEVVSFKYGSKHNRFERKAAKQVADHYDKNVTEIDITSAMSHMESNLMKDGGEIPEGHYEDETMQQTVVPGRNIIFASFLAGLAWTKGCEQVWLGIHSGDHAIYPDCRPSFFFLMMHAIEEGTDQKVHLQAPFLFSDKAGILGTGLPIGVPYDLTRTCYKDQAKACGKCGACQERLEAFKLVGQEDPVLYESTP